MKPYVYSLIIFLLLLEVFSVMPPKPTESNPVKNKRVLSGIIHVHSVYSDGGGTVEEIAEAARLANRDFVVLTDHNVSTARKVGKEKNYNGVDLFVEMEASTQAGHALSFYSHSEAKNLADAEINRLTYQHYMGEKSAKDFFISLSHPSNIKNPWLRFDRYGEGYEIMNFDSVWQRELSDSVFGFLTTGLISPLNPYLATLRFLDFYQKDLTVWDNMNLSPSQKHFGILAHDTHSKLKYSGEGFLRWPDYLQTFKIGTNLVFLKEDPNPDFHQRKAQIYSAIKEARVAIAFDSIYPVQDVEHSVRCGDKTYISGDEIADSTGCKVAIRFPEAFPYERVIRILKNGDLFKEEVSKATTIEVGLEGSGTYRTEIWIKGRSALRGILYRNVPYLFYNPVYLR